MVLEPFFISPFFRDIVLPFVLVFTLTFAILQNTKLLGDGKKQIDAIVALVIGMILIAFPFARNLIVNLMPFLAVALVVLLVFMLIYGFVYKGDIALHKGVKIAFMIVAGIALVVVLLYAAGMWEWLYDYFFVREGVSQIWVNVLVIVVIAGAMIGVLKSKDKSSSS
jgi:hypothetical protein